MAVIRLNRLTLTRCMTYKLLRTSKGKQVQDQRTGLQSIYNELIEEQEVPSTKVEVWRSKELSK